MTNLAVTPAINGGETSSPWPKISPKSGPVVRDDTASPTGARVEWKSGRYGTATLAPGGGVGVELTGETFTPGRTYTVTMTVWVQAAYLEGYAAGVTTWTGAIGGTPGPFQTSTQKFTAAGYHEVVVEVVTPESESPGWLDPFGNEVDGPIAGASPVYIFVGRLSNSASAGREGGLSQIHVTREGLPGPDPDPDPDPEPVPKLVVGTAATYPVWQVAGFPAPAPARITGAPPGMADDGTHKRLTGTPTEAGTFTVSLDKAGAGGGFDTYATLDVAVAPKPVDPDPGEDDMDEWDEWDELTTRLAPRVAAYVGRPGDADVTATASAQLPVVAEYVRGYTRGRGFEGERPAAPLRAVIVAATARLATNPEQVSVFTTGDYSERPAVLAGWTLTELGVLRRYRRTTA